MCHDSVVGALVARQNLEKARGLCFESLYYEYQYRSDVQCTHSGARCTSFAPRIVGEKSAVFSEKFKTSFPMFPDFSDTGPTAFALKKRRESIENRTTL